jgi:hypothetical protein
MKVVCLTCACLALFAAAHAAAPTARAAEDPESGGYWHDGKAEIDGYRIVVDRYGHPRVGRGVAIYVTEPFSASKHVKLDDYTRHPSDVVDVLKLNLVRDFQTGIYDYHTMVSLFVKSADLTPVKLAFTSSEWCGQVYEELNFEGAKLSERFASYFEDESSSSTTDIPRGGVIEDNLFVLLRGVPGGWLAPGEKRSVPYLAGAFWRHLAHRRFAWSSATIERLRVSETVRVPAGSFATVVYVVRAGDGREGRFFIEVAYPHRIVRWVWTPASATLGAAPGAPVLGGTDSGELTGSTRLEYWKLNDPGDESDLKALGLGPAVR